MSEPLIEIVKRVQAAESTIQRQGIIDLEAVTGDGYNAKYLEYTLSYGYQKDNGNTWFVMSNFNTSVGSTVQFQTNNDDYDWPHMTNRLFVVVDYSTKWTSYQLFTMTGGLSEIKQSVTDGPDYRYYQFNGRLEAKQGAFAAGDAVYVKVPDFSGRYSVAAYTMSTPDTFAVTARVDGHLLTIAADDDSIRPGLAYWQIEQADDASGTNAVINICAQGNLPALVDIAPGVEKYYRIRSVSITGDTSAWTSYTSAVYDVVPAVPAWVSHTYQDNGHLVTWSHANPLDVDYFTLYYNSTASDTGATVIGTAARNAVSYLITYPIIGFFGIRAIGYTGSHQGTVWTTTAYIGHKPAAQDYFDTYGGGNTLGQYLWMQLDDANNLDYMLSQHVTAVNTNNVEGSGAVLFTHTVSTLPYIRKGVSSPAGFVFTGGEKLIFCADVSTLGGGSYWKVEGKLFDTSSNILAQFEHYDFSGTTGKKYILFDPSEFYIEDPETFDWGNVASFELFITGNPVTFLLVYYDDMRIVKADPDDADTYNDTGVVWDFVNASGGEAHWHIYAGHRAGEPSKPFALGNINEVSAWQLAFVAGLNVVSGTVQAGCYKKTSGNTGLAFFVANATAGSWEMYSVDFDASTLYLRRWNSGTSTTLATATLSTTTGQIVWLGVDVRSFVSDPGRIKVYASLVEGNVIQATNLKISHADTAPLSPGGSAGVVTYSSNARFVNFTAGSPAHAEVADVARLLDGPMADAQDGTLRVHLAIADRATTPKLQASVDKDTWFDVGDALDAGKVSKLWESDGGAVAWQTDAAGNLSGSAGLTLKTDTIAESTGAAGVTVDGVLIKDNDIFVDGDNYGLANRMINHNVIPTDHFRSGAIPTGYSWISDTDFDGTPGLVNYSIYGNDHMQASVTTAGYKHFLAKSTTPSSNIGLYGKFSTGIITEMGLRIDDGSNTTFGEIYVTGAPANGTIRVDWRTASGTISTALIPAGTMITLGLIYFHSTGTISGYIRTAYGSVSNIAGASFSSGVLASARSGIFVGANGGNSAVCDWFYSSV